MVNILHLHQLSFFFPFFGLSDSFLSLFPFPTKQTRNKWIWAEFPFGNTDDESRRTKVGVMARPQMSLPVPCLHRSSPKKQMEMSPKRIRDYVGPNANKHVTTCVVLLGYNFARRFMKARKGMSFGSVGPATSGPSGRSLFNCRVFSAYESSIR